MTLPTFLIAGVVKGGTTSLHEYLAQHPDVFMSPVKEPMFFARYEPDPANALAQRRARGFVRDEPAYRALFAGAQGQHAIGESSPYYIYDAGAPARIARLLPDVKIVLVLRDPIERAYSHYLMDVREGAQSLPLLEALRSDHAREHKGFGVSHLYVEHGQYADQIDRFVKQFGRDRILLLFFEDLVQSPVPVLRRVLEFIGVDPAWAERIDTSEAHNPHAVPRGAWVTAALRSPRARALAARVLPGELKRFLRRRVLFETMEKPALSPEVLAFLRPFYLPELPRIEALCGTRPPWNTLLGAHV